MTDKQIRFSGPMIRALLDGRKAQHRIILEPQSGAVENGFAGVKLRYAIGDRLWVREAFVTGFDISDETGRPVGERKVWYRATDAGLSWYDEDSETTLDNPPWRSSIHMPRWASRLTLTVTDVRVQRLQEISEADAWAEGCKPGDLDDYGNPFPAEEPSPDGHGWVGWECARDWFWDFWNSIHGDDAWDADPWVAAYTFTVQHGNIDQIGGAA